MPRRERGDIDSIDFCLGSIRMALDYVEIGERDTVRCSAIVHLKA
jgi:hypothetical protein